jgi:hypothetical protein
MICLLGCGLAGLTLLGRKRRGHASGSPLTVASLVAGRSTAPVQRSAIARDPFADGTQKHGMAAIPDSFHQLEKPLGT